MGRENKICFTDSQGDALFTIPDGGKIVINYEWGEKVERPCRFIDEYHAEIGNNLYHICQFAELMERNGHTYEPKQEEQPPQKAPKKKDHER